MGGERGGVVVFNLNYTRYKLIPNLIGIVHSMVLWYSHSTFNGPVVFP